MSKKGLYDFRSTLPDSYAKVLARNMMNQLRDNWRRRRLGMLLGKVSTWVPQISGRYHTTSCTDRRAAWNAKG